MTATTDGATPAGDATPEPVQGQPPASTPVASTTPVQEPQGPGEPKSEVEKLRALTSRLQSERDQYQVQTHRLETAQAEMQEASNRQYLQQLAHMPVADRSKVLENEFQSAVTPDAQSIESTARTKTLTDLLGDAKMAFSPSEWDERSQQLRMGQLTASSLMEEAYGRRAASRMQASSISGDGAPTGPDFPDVGVSASPAMPNSYTPEEISDIAATDPSRYRELVEPGGQPKPGVTLTIESDRTRQVPMSE